MSLTKEELLHLAKLSRLKIEEGSFEPLRAQLEGILEYVGRLQSIELPAVTHADVPAEAVVRPDVAEPSSSELLRDVFEAFPDRAENLLRVPGVFDNPKD